MPGKSSKKRDQVQPASATGQGLFVLVILSCMVMISIFAFDTQAGDSRYLVRLANNLPAFPKDMPGAEQVRSDFAQAMEREQPVSILKRDLDTVVRQFYESSPYVRRVVSMKRRFPGGLKVDIEFRHPIAMVETGGHYVLVDQYGELLPIEVPLEEVVRPIISVRPEGDLRNDPGEYGEQWFLDAIKEGVAVLLDLEGQSENSIFDSVNIVGIDVSNHGGRISEIDSEVSLVTDRTWFDAKSNRHRNTLLAWGRSTKHPGHWVELPVETKLDNLRRLLLARPSGLRGLRVADLRFDQLYYREK